MEGVSACDHDQGAIRCEFMVQKTEEPMFGNLEGRNHSREPLTGLPKLAAGFKKAPPQSPIRLSCIGGSFRPNRVAQTVVQQREILPLCPLPSPASNHTNPPHP